MSGFGTLFQVEERTREALVACTSKSDWYGALAELERGGGMHTVDAGDSIHFWRHLLEDCPGPLNRLFSGEFSTLSYLDTSGDPNLFFSGAALVEQAAIDFGKLTGATLRRMFPDQPEHMLLPLDGSLRSLQAFVASAAASGRAIVGLWH